MLGAHDSGPPGTLLCWKPRDARLGTEQC